MALLTLQPIPKAGITPTFTAVNSTDTVSAIGDTQLLRVKNGSGSSVTVTITDAGTSPSGSAATAPTVVVPATTGDVTIPLYQSYVNQATGLITVGYSSVTTVTAALLTV